MKDVAAKPGRTAKVATAAKPAPAPAVAKAAVAAVKQAEARPATAPKPAPAAISAPAPSPAPSPIVAAKPAAVAEPKPTAPPAPVAAAPEPVAPSAPKAEAPAIVATLEPVVAPPPVSLPTPIAPIGAPTAAKDVMMDTIKTMTDKAQAMFTTDQAKGAIEKGQKMFDEMNSFSKGNIEAIVESSKIAAKGFETLGQDAAAYAKKSFEEASTAVKTMASIKSPTEFMKLQSDYVRSAFDMMVAETSRSTEAMLKLAGEVAQPISNRVALAAEKVKIAA